MALFFRLLFENDKEAALSEAVKLNGNEIYETRQESFENIPTSPFSYWVDESVTKKFKKYPKFESSDTGIKATKGLATTDDFRFIRTWWEVDASKWNPLAKGGSYSQYHADINLVINWNNGGKELKAYLDHKIGKSGQWSRWINAVDYYGEPGLTWPNATTSDLSVRALPAGCVFSHMAPTAFTSQNDDMTRLAYLALMNSSVFRFLTSLSLGLAAEGRKHYEVGVIQNLPLPDISANCEELAAAALTLWESKKRESEYKEISRFFAGPKLLEQEKDIDVDENSQSCLLELAARIEKICCDLYEVSDVNAKKFNLLEPSKDFQVNTSDDDSKKSEKYNFLSWVFGVVVGRFSRNKSALRNEVLKTNPFSSLPLESPAMVSTVKGLGVIEQSELVKKIFNTSLECGIDLIAEDEQWIKVKFFEFHLKRYTDSRRQAPIYWPLQTSSGTYTIWVYYHRLNEQTLYTCVNDFVEPKLEQIEQDLNTLRNKSARSSQEEKELAKLTDFEAELKDFRDELLRLAKFWKPNLNDGVQITAAPLWKLFQHKAWQKKLKDTWNKLEKGEYDWAHLACSIWPERVLKKCHQDRSLAIAHEVENIFWYEVEVPVKRGKKLTDETKLEWQPKDLCDSELDALIKQTIAEMN